jgi:hypothetical protein
MNDHIAAELHEKAMLIAEKAMLARFGGHSSVALEYYKEAFNYEKKAALSLVNEIDLEPTRSILFRSAAALAMECGELIEAEKMIANALIGNPAEQIAEELHDLLEKVNFRRHLALRGVHLEDDEMQLSISGDAIGYGIAESKVFMQRVAILEPLIHRTAERLKGKPFRKAGPTSGDIKSELGIYLSIPRAASFAISVKISQTDQPLLPGFSISKDVIDEIFESLVLLNEENEQALKTRIADDNYYSNFMALAKELSPDGEQVRQVGITIYRNGDEKAVALRRTKSNIALIGTSEIQSATIERNSITGVLRFADSTHEDGKIKIIDSSGKQHIIVVPVSLMTDIVRPLWDKKVRVDGNYIKGIFNLQNIEAIEEQ